ncbi:unnamed protein product, partial [Arabidopsis halleri]
PGPTPEVAALPSQDVLLPPASVLRLLLRLSESSLDFLGSIQGFPKNRFNFRRSICSAGEIFHVSSDIALFNSSLHGVLHVFEICSLVSSFRC